MRRNFLNFPLRSTMFLKVHFKDGGWVIARFSGTEPLLRIFCEMSRPDEAKNICEHYEAFLNL